MTNKLALDELRREIDKIDDAIHDLLMRRTARDFAVSTSPTKRKYMRARPFTVNGAVSRNG